MDNQPTRVGHLITLDEQAGNRLPTNVTESLDFFARARRGSDRWSSSGRFVYEEGHRLLNRLVSSDFPTLFYKH